LWKTQDPNDPNLSKPFYIGSDYHYPDYNGSETVAGEWTSFFDVANDSATIKNLINNGNPESIALEQHIQCLDPTYVQPGTKTDIYNVLLNKMQSNPPNYPYYLPVVKLDSLDTHSMNPVKVWIQVKLLDSVGNNKKYILAQFVKRGHAPSNWKGTGPCYGVFGSPRMVQ
jgi:hypothetical protein